MDTHISNPSDVDQLSRWLAAQVAAVLERPASEILVGHTFSQMALDSARMLTLAGRISEGLGLDLSPTVLFDFPSVERLAAHLAGRGADVALPLAPMPMPQALGEGGVPSHRAQVAIIGMDCRFPGADGLAAFWDLLKHGRNAIQEVPSERAQASGWHPAPDAPHRFVGLVDAIDAFDAGLFGISPREAKSMDPQQRMLLETAWHALEHGGIAPDGLHGSRTGVFVGIFSNDYFRAQCLVGTDLQAHAGTGGSPSIAASRISYCLGLEGPSMTIDTACSSSLVAMHQACQSLVAGECDLAIAGGANLVLCEDLGLIFGKAGMLAADGQCKTFDASANGYVRGEGCGVVILKRLDKALQDGDQVLAVIAGSAVNQDGASNGLTAPNGLAQQRVVKAALNMAGITGRDIDYIETHGTGTSLGDPIEVMALRASIDDAVAGRPCWLGAVKTQIGHLEAAAGVAGVIKAVLAMQHELIPGNGHFKNLNPKIDLGASRLKPVVDPVPWLIGENHVRRAGVSSFGFGGTNAHVILQEAPLGTALAVAHAGPALYVLSARSPAALKALARQHADAVRAGGTDGLWPLCRTGILGRATLPQRLAIAAPDAKLLATALDGFAGASTAPQDVVLSASAAGKRPRMAFLFTGQGSQYRGMGEALYQSEAAFRRMLDRCNKVLTPFLGVDLPSLLWGDQASLLSDTRYGQPALVALQVSLVALWDHHGVRPEAVCGHSVGEYAAAYTAGLMELDAMLYLVAMRGRLMSSTPKTGGMLSVAADEATIEQALGGWGGLEVAGRNSPRQTVLAGDADEIARVADKLAAQHISVSRLPVDHAFHSRAMDTVEPLFDDFMDDIELARPRLTFIPTAGGARTEPWQRRYWSQQIRQPVMFEAALKALESQGIQAYIEIGPGSTLLGLVRDTLAPSVRIPSLRANVDAALQWRGGLGAWWAAGGSADLSRLVEAGQDVARCRAPVYPFERESYWFDLRAAERSMPMNALSGQAAWPGVPLTMATSATAVTQVTAPDDLPCLSEHVLAGVPVMPAAAYLSLMLASSLALNPVDQDEPSIWEARDCRFERVLEIGSSLKVQLALTPQEAGHTAEVHSQEPDSKTWTRHMMATVSDRLTAMSLPALPESVLPWHTMPPEWWYAQWAQRGLDYGASFQLVKAIETQAGQARAQLIDTLDPFLGTHTLHPAWLDAVIQTACAACATDEETRRVLVPVQAERFSVDLKRMHQCSIARAVVRSRDARSCLVDVSVTDELGATGLLISGLRLTWIDAAVQPVEDSGQMVALQTAWQVAEPALTDAPGHWLVLGSTIHGASEVVARLVSGGARAAVASQVLPTATLTSVQLLMEELARPGTSGLLVCLDDDPHLGALVDQGIQHCKALQMLLLNLNELSADIGGRPVFLLTRGAASTHADEVMDVAHAGAAAMWRSAAHELSSLNLAHVDLPLPWQGSAQDDEALVRALSFQETQLSVRQGRVLVPRLERRSPAPRGATPWAVHGDGAYLITGGTGSLGMHVARWLIDQGAKHLCLVSRTGVATAADTEQIARWQEAGCRVAVMAVDVAQQLEVQQLIAQIRQDGVPLRGVVHAAGCTADASLARLESGSWNLVAAGKVLGVHWLDMATRDATLDFFVGFSSATAPLGSPGQCNYAAANAMLEACLIERAVLPEARHGRTLAIQWGPWAGEGMASAIQVRQALAQKGLLSFEPDMAVAALQAALSHGPVVQMAGRFDWPAAAASWAPRPLPSLLRGLAAAHVAETGTGARSSARPTIEVLANMDRAEVQQAIRTELAAQLCDVLRVSLDDLPVGDADRFDALRLSSLGLDSLMAMEMRNRIRQWVRADVPTELLIGAAEVGQVVQLIQQKVLMQSLSRPDSVDGSADSDGEMEVMVL